MTRVLVTAASAALTLAIGARLLYLIRDLQVVPPGLGEDVALMQAAGWYFYRRHPLFCREAGPYVHLGAPGGRAADLTVFTDGQVRFR